MVDSSVWSLVRHKSNEMWEDSNPDAYAGISNRFQTLNDYPPAGGGQWLNIKTEKFVGNTLNTEDEDYHPDAVPSHTLLDEGFPLEFETKKRRRRNTTKPKEKKKIVAKRKSKYRGVSWSKPSQKWTAQVSHGGSKYYAGLYSSDLDAAHAVNRECDRLMITRRNPGIGDPPVNLKKKQVRKKAARVSRYLGVSWCKNANKWQARVWHKGKYHWAGYYDTDKEAVDAMYNTCKILNIPRVKQDLIRMPELRILQSKKWLVSTDSHTFTLNEKGEFDWRDGILRGRLRNFTEPKGTLHAKFSWGAMTGTIYFVRLEREGFDGIYESTCGTYGRWIGTPFQSKKSNKDQQFFYRMPPANHGYGKNSKKRYLNMMPAPNVSNVLNPPPQRQFDKITTFAKNHNSKKRYLNIVPSGNGLTMPIVPSGNGLNMPGMNIVPSGNGLPMPLNFPPQEYSRELMEKPAKRRKVSHLYSPRRLDDFSIHPPNPPRSPSLTPEPIGSGDVQIPMMSTEVKQESAWDSFAIPDLPPPAAPVPPQQPGEQDSGPASNVNKRESATRMERQQVREKKLDTLTRMERQQVRAKKLEPIFTTIGREGKAVNLFCNHCKEKFTAKPTFRARYGHYLVNHRCIGMDHRQQYVVGMKRRDCELNCSSSGCISLEM